MQQPKEPNLPKPESHLAKPDPVHEKRVAEARARHEQMVEQILASDVAEWAAEDWNDMKEPGDPAAEDLSRKDAYEWTLSFAQYKEGELSEEQLAEVQSIISAGYRQPAQAGQRLATAGPRSDTGVDRLERPRSGQAAEADGDAQLADQTTQDAQPAETEVAAPGEDPLTGLLSALRRLSKSDKHKVIAKDFLARAKRGEDVEAEAGAWVNAVTADERGVTRFSARVAEPAVDAATLSEEEFDAVVKRVTSRWKRPDGDSGFTVVDTYEGLPVAVLRAATAQNVPHDEIHAVFHNGHMYLAYISRIRSPHSQAAVCPPSQTCSRNSSSNSTKAGKFSCAA